jgi:mitogen-activated protein kinase kinase
MNTPMLRPVGPRSNPRSVSPAPYTLRDQSHNRRPSVPSTLSLKPPAVSLPPSSSSRSLKLQIPGIAAPKPTLSKGLPMLQIPKSNENGQSKGDSPSFDAAFEAGGYYGGPLANPAELSSESPGEVTMRPPSRTTPKPPDSIEDIEKTLKDISLRTKDISNGNGPTASMPVYESSYGLQQEEVSRHVTASDWSDAVLEELNRLGEGAGGAVHEVKDKRTGVVMARKTITTREAPMKQLLRELSIISSSAHPNIILFHGAYMSPSSSEVKILMEFCPGGSLEAVAKRVADRNARVGEKVAGRLAEGVSFLLCASNDCHEQAICRF